jgi:signal transduction histidine kinase
MRLRPARPPRLWTLLLLSNVATLALPLTGLWALRLYESALVRQTEAELVAQGAVLAATFHEALRRESPGVAAEPPPALGGLGPRPALWQGLDLARDAVLPPLPPAAAATTTASAASLAAGRTLAPILHDAQSITLAAVRLTDAHGIVVASSGGDLGLSLAAWPEVAAVIGGAAIATTMHRRDVVGPLNTDVSRTNGIRVFVVLPVQDPSGTAAGGTVIVSRSAKTLDDAARGNLGMLALFAAVLLTAGTLLALALASMITRPLAAIVRQAQQVAAGGDAGPVLRPGTREVADLSAALTRMAATLDQRARYIAAFAGSVSHAFKTPLAALRGAAELLQDAQPIDTHDDRQRLLHIVADSTARLTLLVTRMLALAKADMTRPGNGPPVPIAPILTRLAEQYRDEGLTVLISGPPLQTRLTEEAFEAILVSLLDNAAIHAGPSATVHMSTTSRGDRTQIDIQDNGPGISAANQARVFDPFFTTAPEIGGTGLGLPTARAIAAGAGGSLDIVSGGDGAHFRLILPNAAPRKS